MKKVISLLLTLAIVLTSGFMPQISASAADADYVATVQGEYVQSAQPQEIVIRISTPGVKNAYASMEIDDLTLPQGFVFVRYATSNSANPVVNTDYNSSGYLSYTPDAADIIPMDTYYDLTILAPAEAVGEYPINLGYVATSWNKGTDVLEAENVSTTFTIASKPATPAADYEIWYTLNQKADTEKTGETATPDGYKELKVGDEVTATVYLKNNKADTTLQAYDVYLTHSKHLTPKALGENAVVDLFVGDKDETDDVKEAHIQFVADKANQKAFAKDAIVELGTITFTVEDTAIFGEGMDITLIPGSDQDGEETTNIAIGSTFGDKKSYYPGVINTVKETIEEVEKDVTYKGVEIIDTYTVTYDANDGTWGENVPAPTQTKQHNVDLVLEAEVPERVGYTFMGWQDNKQNSYEIGDVYQDNADLALIAQWQKNTVQVTWMNGETQLKQEDVDYGTVPAYQGDTPEKTDPNGQYTYTFTGWTTEKNGTSAETLSAVTVDTTYYAVFSSELTKYTITWLNQNGSELEEDADVAYGTALSTIAPAAPTKSADNTYTYTFAGWATSANQESGTPVNELGTVTKDATYYAAFAKTPIEYTVNYSDDGKTTTVTANYNDTITLPQAVGKSGYTFDGWYSGNSLIGKDGESYTVTADVTLTAKYSIITYTIEYNENGGNEVSDDTYTVEDNINLPIIEKEGATFGGWYEEADFSGEAVSAIAKGTTGNKTYYAKWTNNDYIITNAKVDNGTVNAVNNKDNGTSANKDDTINVTVRPNAGYEIATVTYTPENGNAVTIAPVDGKYSFSMPAANVTVSATFTAIDYTVVVDEDIQHGTVIVTPSTANIGDTITVNVTPDNGYNIKSVSYKQKDGTTTVINAQNGKYSFQMPADNVEVTAEFEAISYTITYNTNDGSVIEEGSYTVEDTLTLPTTSTKIGYDFGGWYENEALDGDAVTEIKAGTTGDKTFYAKWNPRTDTKYTVNHWQQNVGGGAEENNTNFTMIEFEELTGTTDAKVTPDRKAYNGFTAPAGEEVTIKADGTTVVDYYYTRNVYNITLNPNDGSYGENVTAPEDYTFGTTVTLPTEITKDGYTFGGWFDNENLEGDPITDILETDNADKTYWAKWVAVEYTITLDLQEGTFDSEGWTEGDDGTYTKTYTIEDTLTLPEMSKAYYIFSGWKVTAVEDEGNWDLDAEFSSEYLDIPEGRFGNITLTAQYDRMANPVVEEYKYAYTGQWMIRVDATDLGENQEYRFNNEPMYYTEDENYLVEPENTGVFYYLVAADYITDGALNDTGYDLLTIETTESGRKELDKDGDINGDGVLNIADANIVYQMIEQSSAGGYYTGEQLGMEARLKADMDTATTNAHHRGSIADVQMIVDMINGVSATN